MHSNLSYLSKLKSHKRKKSKLSEVGWVKFDFIEPTIDLKVHNDLSCSTEIELAYLSKSLNVEYSAESNIRLRIHTKKQNNEKYVARRRSSAVTRQKIIHEQ